MFFLHICLWQTAKQLSPRLQNGKGWMQDLPTPTSFGSDAGKTAITVNTQKIAKMAKSDNLIAAFVLAFESPCAYDLIAPAALSTADRLGTVQFSANAGAFETASALRSFAITPATDTDKLDTDIVDTIQPLVAHPEWTGTATTSFHLLDTMTSATVQTSVASGYFATCASKRRTPSKGDSEHSRQSHYDEELHDLLLCEIVAVGGEVCVSDE